MNEHQFETLLCAALVAAYVGFGESAGSMLKLARTALLFLAIYVLTGCTHYKEEGLSFTAVGGIGTVQRTDPSGSLIVGYDNTDSFRNAMQTAGTLGTAAIWGSVQKAKFAADTAVSVAGIEGATSQAMSANEVAKRMSDNETKAAIQGIIHQ